MKKFLAFSFSFILTFLFLTFAAHAQVMDPPTSTEVGAFFSQLTHLSGGAVGIILVAVQGIMLLVRQFVQGKWKLAIVSGLTIIAAIVGGLVEHKTLMEIIMSSAVLTALQVFGSQIVTQVGKKE